MNDLLAPANGGAPMTYAEALEHVDLTPAQVVRRFGTWAVTTWGMASLQTRYEITAVMLPNMNWPAHLAEKRWVVARDAQAAYDYALMFFAEREVAA